MNLELGILWIEDTFSGEEKVNLERRVSDAGFIAQIDWIPNGSEIEKYAHEHNLYQRYGIILLDYRLENSEYGDDLAPKIRHLFPSTTILFYSGSTTSEDELRQKIARKRVEGVYCCVRQRYIERAGELIDQTACALNRLSGMRGLAMKVVAECDDLMKTAILSMCERDPIFAAQTLELDKDVREFIAEITTKYETATKDNLESRLSARAVDSAKLFKHFRRLTQVAVTNPLKLNLSSAQVDHLRELRQKSAQYVESVLKKRNKLGHVKEVKGANGWKLEDSSEINVNDFPIIRQDFSTHINAFREMRDLVMVLDKK